MAFTRTKFSGNLGAGGGAAKLFMYDGAGVDTKAAVIASGFFDPVYQHLAVNDIIIAGTTTTPVMLYIVSITAGVVVTGYVAVA